MLKWKSIPLSFALTGIALTGVVACSSQQNEHNSSENTAHVSAEMKNLSGTITYREHILLPEHAVLTVRLEDAAKQDVAATVIASQTMSLTSPPPWQFDLQYDPSTLSDKGNYSVRARIEVDGKLQFMNVKAMPAFDSTEPVNIIVTSMKQNISDEQVLTEHHWRLTTLNNKPVKLPDNSQPIDLNFDDANKRVAGFSGCNRFSGGFVIKASTLTFTQMLSTLMACEMSDVEQAYLKALSEVASYNIDNTTLQLLDDNKKILATFLISGKLKV